MINDIIWKLVQYIDPGVVMYFSCGLMLLIFLIWLIKYQLVILGGITHSLKKMNKVLIFGRSHSDNIARIDEIHKNEILDRMWINYCDDYAAGTCAPASQYISQGQLLGTYARKEISGIHKYITLLIAFATCLIGVLLTAVRWQLTIRQLATDSNIAFMGITIFAVAAILFMLYLMLEHSGYNSALRQWGIFEDLSARRLPVFVPSKNESKFFLKLSNIERLIASCNQQLLENNTANLEHVDMEMEYLERLSQGFISETTGTLTSYIQQLSEVLESNIKTQLLVRDSLKLLLNDLAIGVKDQRTINTEIMQMLQKIREEGT